jgi:two-component system, OmpR family, response regulator
MAKKKPYVIFLVEDDQVFAKTLELHLKEHLKFKFDIFTFPNGEDCLANLEMKPSIVILDYFLNSQNPKAQNGLEILQKIKKLDPEIEVIMLSVQDKIQVAVNSMIHGAYNYLTKNEVAFFRVENTIVNILKVIRSRDELKAVKKGEIMVFILIGVIAAIAGTVYYFYPFV